VLSEAVESVAAVIIAVLAIMLPICGIGWGFSMLDRKTSLAELMGFVAFWAAYLGAARWVIYAVT
jgi:hypothetical protein